MTPEESIRAIKCAIGEVEWDYPIDYAEAFKNAIEALKKQVPRHPKLKDLENIFCPSCGRYLFESHDYYCINCGQRFNWKWDDDESLTIDGKKLFDELATFEVAIKERCRKQDSELTSAILEDVRQIIANCEKE